MLRGIKFFVVGLLIDCAEVGALLTYLWVSFFGSGRGPSTAEQYVSGAVFILWMGALHLVGFWPLSIPLLLAPPAVGLWKDLRVGGRVHQSQTPPRVVTKADARRG